MKAQYLRVYGVVQGSYYKEYIYTQAHAFGVAGWVGDSESSVDIFAQAPEDVLNAFILEISGEGAPQARVREIDLEEVEAQDLKGFEILTNRELYAQCAVSPDRALCEACRSELLDPKHAQYYNPFISCSQCGPRASLARSLPLLRENTYCSQFAGDYHIQGELGRRYGYDLYISQDDHPKLIFTNDNARLRLDTVQALQEGLQQAAESLRDKQVLLVDMGPWGGSCLLAEQQTTLQTFLAQAGLLHAGMLSLLHTAKDALSTARMSKEEEALLERAEHPCVLLKRKEPGSGEEACLLAATPLLALLCEQGFSRLSCVEFTECEKGVYKKYNLASAYIGIDPQAHPDLVSASLKPRSVLRLIPIAGAESALQIVERGRGYEPLPIPCKSKPLPTVGTYAQEGDVYALHTRRGVELTKGSQEELQEIYASSQDGEPLARVGEDVSYHHALAAAVLGEHGIAGAAMALVCDEPHKGRDCVQWGGEMLFVNATAFERFANLAYLSTVPSNPAQSAYNSLYALDLHTHPACTQIFAQHGLNCASLEEQVLSAEEVYSSSVEDFAYLIAYLLGFEQIEDFFAQAGSYCTPSLVDTLDERYRMELLKNVATPESNAEDTSVLLIDPTHTISAVLDDIERGVDPAQVGACAIASLFDALRLIVRLAKNNFGLDSLLLVGSYFAHYMMMEMSIEVFGQEGISIGITKDLPPTSSAAAFGRLVVSR